MEGHPTILDIARLTGLSKGTVDRVLHNRGEVSKKSQEKVMKAIEELGYEPNVYASLLASNRKFTIAVLIPHAVKGEFWEISLRGVELAQRQLHVPGVSIVHVGYDQYDGAQFREACGRLLEMRPDGVVVAPMYRQETSALTSSLKEMGIPYVYVDSKIDDDDYLAYFGMPMFNSGYLCADLLTQGRRISSVLIVRIRRNDEERYDPNVHRRSGFTGYILEHNPECSIHYVFIDPTQPDKTGPALSDFHERHPEVRNVVMFNSRIHLITPFIEKSGIRDVRVIGFDNLDANVEALRRGTVTMLIAQHPDEQVNLAIQTLADFLAIKKVPARRDNLMHMDILTRYNVDYY